jgi:hypothetical protein
MKLIPIKTEEFGHFFLLASTEISVQIFPAKVLFFQNATQIHSLDLPIQGPVFRFFVEYTIQKGQIKVSMQTKNGFFSYSLFAENKAIYLKVLKAFKEFSLDGYTTDQQKRFELVSCFVEQRKDETSLFLGSMKTKDAAILKKQRDLTTLLPWVFALFQTVPQEKNKAVMIPSWQTLFSAKNSIKNFFECTLSLFTNGFFVPSSTDLTFQKVDPLFPPSSSILQMVSSYKELLFKTFLMRENFRYHFLPFVPKAWHQGEFLNYQDEYVLISFKWSRGKLRDVTIKAKQDCELELVFPKEIRSFVVFRQKEKIFQNPYHIGLKKNQTILIDNFNK